MVATDLVCQELVELVTAYLEGVLPAPERARFDAHLVDCPFCTAYLAQMRLTIRTVGVLTPETIDPAARDLLLTQFRAWNRR